MKRLLASLLCATLIISPVGNAATVYATEPTEVIQEVQETQEGQQEEETDAAAAEESVSDGASAEQTTGETPAEGEDAGKEGSESGETPADGAGEETSGDETSEVTPGEEVTPTDPEAGEEVEDITASDEDEAATENSDAAAELIEDEIEATDIEDAEELLKISSELFDIDADGTLQLKPGKTPADLGTTVSIPVEVKKIPAGIFNEYLDASGNKTTPGCLYVIFQEGSQLESIEAGAFKGSLIKQIEIPSGVTQIESETFSGTPNLTSVTFKGKVESIGNLAFYSSGIANIRADFVTSVGNNSFALCSSLTSVTMGSLETIGNQAFSGCTALYEMNFTEALRFIGDSAFAGCAFLSVDLSVVPDTESLIIGQSCFQNNDNLATVKFPNCIDTIPTKAFTGNPKLTTVSFGKDFSSRLRVIGNSAFENCTSITNILLYNVYEINTKAFAGCTDLASVKIYNMDTESADFQIAEDAFPNKPSMKLYGYDGKVLEYANRKGYKYETLATKYNVSFSVEPKNSATVNISETKAAKDTKIRVKVTPAEEYAVKDISIEDTIHVDKDDIVLVENTENYKIFEFPMTAGDVNGEIVMAKSDKIISGELAFVFKDTNSSPSVDGKFREFGYPGILSKFVISAGGTETNSWLWNFTSSNTKVATVTASGQIRSTGVGTAKITAALKNDSTKKKSIDVRVLQDAAVSDIELVLPTVIPRARIDSEVVDGEEIPVILYEKSTIAGGAKSFDVSIKAHSDGLAPSTNLVVNSKWTTTDKGVAGLSVATSTTNTNTIKISKNATGESLITVSVLNKDEKTPSEDNIKSFIVRIVDATPRLENSTITVDSRSTQGTALKIVQVYDYEIAGYHLTLTEKKVDSKGVASYNALSELYVERSEGVYYIKNSNPNKPFEKTYENKLYLEGTFDSTDSFNGTTFYIPITKLTVTNKALNPTLKTTGKINLFYNSTAGSDLSGIVTVTQSLKDITVRDVKLVSSANHKKAGTESTDSFDANFDIVPDKNNTFVVTRTATDLVKVGGKNVTSGYIYIYYDGYSKPVTKAITIPTCDTAPAYVLNQTSATASIYSSNQEYELKLVDKKTKKQVQSLEDLDTEISESGNIIGLGFNASTTDGVFEDITAADVAASKVDNIIRLRVNGVPSKGKAGIYVRMTTWSRALTFNFTLKTTSALPTVKFSTGTVTLNKNYRTQEAEIKVTENQQEAKMAGFQSVQYTGKKNVAEAQALINAMTVTLVTDGSLDVKFSLPAKDVPKGTYSFKVTPRVTYDGVENIPTKVQTIKVVVAETRPSIKLNNGTFKFNVNGFTSTSPNEEEVVRTYKLGNLPTGVTGTVVSGSEDYEPVGHYVDFDDVVKDIDFVDGNVVATINTNATTTISYAGKTLKYKVKGLEVQCGSDVNTVPDFTISIKLDKKAASVKVKAQGALNPIDEASKVTYTATISNLVSVVDDVYIWEKDDQGNWYNNSGNRYSKNFEIAQDITGKPNVAYLTMKDGAVLVNNKKYSIRINYTLTAAPGKVYSADFTVVPKQKLPTITTENAAATIYSGQTNKTFAVTIKQKSSKNMMDVTMTQPKFADGTPDNIKKAFKITGFTNVADDPSSGIMTVELVNSSAIVQNKTYTLNFVTTYENQAEKSTGNKFSVKVTVKK